MRRPPLRHSSVALAGLVALLAGALVVAPSAGIGGRSVAGAAPITCANGNSPLSLTYDTTGLATPSITLPLNEVGTAGVVVDWGDGTTSTYTVAGYPSHTFPTPGPYAVQICGQLKTFGGGSAAANVATLVAVNSFGTLDTLGSLYGAFHGATNLVSVPSTLPTTVTKIPEMFWGATKFNDANIKLWDTSRITDMSNAFYGASAFNQNLSTWSQAANVNLYGMFTNATAFNNGCATGAFNCPLTWTTPNVVTVESTFRGASAFNQNVNTWSSAKYYNLKETFSLSGFNNGCADGDTSCPLTWTIPVATDLTLAFFSASIFNQNITRLMDHPNNVTKLIETFRAAVKFNNGDNIPPINNLVTSKVTKFTGMFYGPGNGYMAFNRHIEGWDMSAATDIAAMFRGSSAFNNGCAKGDRSCPLTWTNTGKVTTINEIFAYGGADGATRMSIDQSLNSWDVSSITDYAFAFAQTAFNNGGEPLWSGKTVKTGAVMYAMFLGNTNFNVPVGGLNVSGATNLAKMLSGATKFDQDISGWRVSGLTTQTCCYPALHSMQAFLGVSTLGPLNGISIVNYEKWLNSLSTDVGATTYVPTGTIMNMGNSKYTCNTKDLRAALATKFTLTDGGMVALPAPTINSVTAGDGYLDVAFSAPRCLGVPTAPTSYQYSVNNGANWATFAAPTPDPTADGTVRISDLNNGTTYPVSIRAYLAGYGYGAQTAAVNGTPVGPTILEPVVTIADKTYDGTTRATVTGCTLRVRGSSPAQYITDASIVSCDIAAATGTFANANARPTLQWTAKWFITTTFHDQHHKYFTANFGGYTTIWDRLCGTMRPKFEQDYLKVKDRARSAPALEPAE